MTLEQALTLKRGQELHAGRCVRHVGPHGGVHEHVEKWRVTGKLKRRRGVGLRFSVPIRHGLRDNMYLTDYNREHFHLASECPLLDDVDELRHGRKGNDEHTMDERPDGPEDGPKAA
jgi:hypothetical protein